MDKTHKQFQDLLNRSAEGTQYVAQILRNNGREVIVPEYTVAPERADWRDHSDSGDLFMSYKGSDECNLLIEVKWLNSRLTDIPKQWKYYPNFIVDDKAAFDRKKRRPDGYVILSPNKLYTATVNVAKTINKWFVKDREDHRRNGYKKPYYLCPIELVRFQLAEKTFEKITED